jgi:hypothetical protein
LATNASIVASAFVGTHVIDITGGIANFSDLAIRETGAFLLKSFRLKGIGLSHFAARELEPFGGL